MSDMKIFNVPTHLIQRCEASLKDLPPYRSEFMRDRDRIMYATAFRRLAGKTQIYTVGSDDHRKNRLTHTLEVSQIARTISTALHLDTDLSEAIALAHDFGHTPFGHAGEERLNEIMIPKSEYIKGSPFFGTELEEIKRKFEREASANTDYPDQAFGFKHNIQSVRACMVLEDSYRDTEKHNVGLNLTNFTLYGMMAHTSQKYKGSDEFPNYQKAFEQQIKMLHCDTPAWSFEAFIVKHADDIAQWHHDLEDAMREGVLPLQKICATIKESLSEALDIADSEKLALIEQQKDMDRKCIADLSHIVVNTLVNDLVNTSQANFEVVYKYITEQGISPDHLFVNINQLSLPIPYDSIINFSKKIKSENFKGTIKEAIHHSRNVERMNAKGQYIIRKLFEAYYAHPQQLPDGPIVHFMVESGLLERTNIDDAKKEGIGMIRLKFERAMQNPNVYQQCLLMRRICDHIASMTDRYAIEEYNNLYG